MGIITVLCPKPPTEEREDNPGPGVDPERVALTRHRARPIVGVKALEVDAVVDERYRARGRREQPLDLGLADLGDGYHMPSCLQREYLFF